MDKYNVSIHDTYKAKVFNVNNWAGMFTIYIEGVHEYREDLTCDLNSALIESITSIKFSNDPEEIKIHIENSIHALL